MKRPDTLYVQMFDSFQISYGGQPLTMGTRRDTHFSRLMQILLHNVNTGVSKDYLEDVLLGERDVENRTQVLQTIIYKAKCKLRSMGLPDVNYIFLEKGIYHWTPLIPVEEDAAVFETYYMQIAETKEEEERLELCRSACYIYKGEFLAAYAGVLWAASQARYYREMFCSCVCEAASILRKRHDWDELEKLGNYAMKVDPFADWESLTMEALISNGRYEEARQLYADTVDIYLTERGIYPNEKMMEMMEDLGKKMEYAYGVLDQIQNNLMEQPQDIRGGYQCSYPVFRGVYQAINRMMERGGQSAYLMLCTLVDGKGNPMKEGKRQEMLSQRLGEAICQSVRHGDIINRYGKGQFLVLLINTTRENCVVVERRINQKFMTEGQRTGVQYHVNSVICQTWN